MDDASGRYRFAVRPSTESMLSFSLGGAAPVVNSGDFFAAQIVVINRLPPKPIRGQRRETERLGIFSAGAVRHFEL